MCLKVADKTNLHIVYNECWQKQWRQWLVSAPRAALEQSWCYGAAMQNYFGTKIEHGVIYKAKKPVALVQIMRKAGLSQLMRGPVLLDRLTTEEIQQIYTLIRARYGWRRDGFLFWTPELESTPENIALLKQCRLWRLQKGYKTIWLDLQQDNLRENLQGKWRNQLHKAERNNIVVKHAKSSEQQAWLLQQYATFRKSRKMAAPSGRFMETTFKAFQLQKDAMPLIAYQDNQAIAGILVLKHGQCATYHMGVTTNAGRKSYAHNILLWHAMQHLQQQDIHWLDMGGLDDKKMAGISRFKRGVGGTEITLAGLYF